MPFLKEGGRLSSDVDFDTITISGVYYFYDKILTGNNAPDVSNVYSAVLIVVQTQSDVCAQILFVPDNGGIYMRRKTSVGWTLWINK